MTEALLQYSSELSNSRIIPETRVRYANKQLKMGVANRTQCLIKINIEVHLRVCIRMLKLLYLPM